MYNHNRFKDKKRHGRQLRNKPTNGPKDDIIRLTLKHQNNKAKQHKKGEGNLNGCLEKQKIDLREQTRAISRLNRRWPPPHSVEGSLGPPPIEQGGGPVRVAPYTGGTIPIVPWGSFLNHFNTFHNNINS